MEVADKQLPVQETLSLQETTSKIKMQQIIVCRNKNRQKYKNKKSQVYKRNYIINSLSLIKQNKCCNTPFTLTLDVLT